MSDAKLKEVAAAMQAKHTDACPSKQGAGRCLCGAEESPQPLQLRLMARLARALGFEQPPHRNGSGCVPDREPRA